MPPLLPLLLRLLAPTEELCKFIWPSPLPFCCCPFTSPSAHLPLPVLYVGSKLLNCTELLLGPFVCSSYAYWMIFRRRDIESTLFFFSFLSLYMLLETPSPACSACSLISDCSGVGTLYILLRLPLSLLCLPHFLSISSHLSRKTFVEWQKSNQLKINLIRTWLAKFFFHVAL